MVQYSSIFIQFLQCTLKSTTMTENKGTETSFVSDKNYLLLKIAMLFYREDIYLCLQVILQQMHTIFPPKIDL